MEEPSHEPEAAPVATKPKTPEMSVVIATYERFDSLLRLLDQLGQQSVGAAAFEVIIVDDGSSSPVGPALDARADAYPLHHYRQANGGAAAARQRGIEHATGAIVVILDDDMEVPTNFLAEHKKAHAQGADVVLGHIDPGEIEGGTSLFERVHHKLLLKTLASIQSGEAVARGVNLCTGNVSFSRAAFLDVGGFDESLKRSEDRELGIRFEKSGYRIEYGLDAESTHYSDHDSLQEWLGRAYRYGVYDRKIALKHPNVEVADPWRYFFLVSPLTRPLLVAIVIAPAIGKPLSRTAWLASRAFDRAGVEPVALVGGTVVYGLEYFRGIRDSAGSLRATAKEFGQYLVKRARTQPTALGKTVDRVAGDFEANTAYRRKYLGDERADRSFLSSLVREIGTQVTVSTRVMQGLRDGGHSLGAQVASRSIRYIFGADVHMDAEFEPGFSVVHGQGLVIAGESKIGNDVILYHNVTLGAGIDPETRESGAPTLEDHVHVGPGVTILGPVTIGARSKILAGTTVTKSCPPDSIIRPADPVVEPRKKRAPAKRTLAANAANGAPNGVDRSDP